MLTKNVGERAVNRFGHALNFPAKSLASKMRAGEVSTASKPMFFDARYSPFALATCPLRHPLAEQAASRTEETRNPKTTMTIIRRIGPDPHANGRKSVGGRGCPDILELDNGDFAIIGIDITQQAIPALPASVGCGPDERIVRLPRYVLTEARNEIPLK